MIVQRWAPLGSEYSGSSHAQSEWIGDLSILPVVFHPQQVWEDLSQQQPVDALSNPL